MQNWYFQRVANPSSCKFIQVHTHYLNGLSSFYLIISQTIESNGLLCSAESTVTRTFNEIASGGANCSGQSISGISLVFTGGILNEGSAVCTHFMTSTNSKTSIILNGYSNFTFKFNLIFSGGCNNNGASIIGIQPKVGGVCLVSGVSPELKLSLPNVGLGSISIKNFSDLYVLFTVQKYQRGQLRAKPKGRIELIKKYLRGSP